MQTHDSKNSRHIGKRQGVVLSGTRVTVAFNSPLSRVCPACNAQPGMRCVSLQSLKASKSDGGRYLKYMVKYHNERRAKRDVSKAMPCTTVAPEYVMSYVRAQPGAGKMELVRTMQAAAKLNPTLLHNVNRLRQLIDAAEDAGLVRIVLGPSNIQRVFPMEDS